MARRHAFAAGLLVAPLAASCGIVDSDEQPEAIRVNHVTAELCSAFCVAGTEERLVLQAYDALSEEGKLVPGVLVEIRSTTPSIEIADTQLTTGPDGTAETAIRFLRPVQAGTVRFELPEERPLPETIHDRGSLIFTVYPDLPEVTITPDSMVLEEGCVGETDWRVTMLGEEIPGVEPEYVGIRSERIAALAPNESAIRAQAEGFTSLYVWLEDAGVRFADEMPLRVTPFEPRKFELQTWQLFLGAPAPIVAWLKGACQTRSLHNEVELTNLTPDVISYDADAHALVASRLGVARFAGTYGSFSDTVELAVNDYRALPLDTTIVEGASFEYRPQFASGDPAYREGQPDWNTRIAYASSDTTVASITTRDGYYGIVTGRKAGRATITLRLQDRHGHPQGPPRASTVTVEEVVVP